MTAQQKLKALTRFTDNLIEAQDLVLNYIFDEVLTPEQKERLRNSKFTFEDEQLSNLVNEIINVD